MRRRRLRPTFLLRITVLAASVALFAGAFAFFDGTVPRVAALLVLLFAWMVGMELELLPLVLEKVAVLQAAGSAREPSRLWFVDVDEEERRERARLSEDLPDNPTLR
jgi:hypothetical protein